MKKEMIMVRYGELSTKGKNKKDFINRLAHNIRRALKQFARLEVQVKQDHIYLILNDEPYEEIEKILKRVSGLYSFSVVYKEENDIEKIKDLCLQLAQAENGSTFKVKAKRADKRFPIRSEEINRLVASHILKNTEYKVDVHNPDLLINITIRLDCCYIFMGAVKGAGGYPLGIQGKGLMMMSGGIDSPVATYLMMKRGISIECIHFAAPPYTNQAVITKIIDLLKILNRYQEKIKLYIVPFTKLQEEIYRHCDESYAITIMRRMMYRISQRVARRNRDLIICNGESIGQVASQTLHSMQVIEKVVELPVIRPLATYDKIDVIKIAKDIETYEISIRPFEDCCTIFDPKNPKTAPKEEDVLAYETKFDYQALIEECLQNLDIKYIDENYNEIDLNNLL